MWALIGTTLAAFGPPLQSHRDVCTERVERRLDQAAVRAERDRGHCRTVEVAIASILDPPPAAGTPATPSGATTSGAKGSGPLTGREWEVACLLARGMSNRAIAAQLVISQRTVDGHVERILAKLEFSARTQVAAWVATRDPTGVTRDPTG